MLSLSRVKAGLSRTGLVVCLCATGVAAPLAARTLDASDPIGIAEYLRDQGYRAQVGRDSYDDPMIETAAAGVNYSIYFYGCSDNRDCQDLQFSAGFDIDGRISPEGINTWNREKLTGKAYVDDEGDPFLELFIPGVTDMREAAFDRTLARWTSSLEDFLDFIDW